MELMNSVEHYSPTEQIIDKMRHQKLELKESFQINDLKSLKDQIIEEIQL